MSARRESMTTAKRVKCFRDAGGICHICGTPIRVGDRWEVSHPTALELGGADDESNRRPAHYACHRTWTAEEDIPAIAKAKRREARHLGVKKPTSRPIPGSRASGIRKRMSGEVERWT